MSPQLEVAKTEDPVNIEGKNSSDEKDKSIQSEIEKADSSYPNRSIENETIAQEATIEEEESTFKHITPTHEKVNYSTTLQKWKGHVTKINESSFTAELEDLTNRGTFEIAQFDFEDVSPDDKKLIDIGAVFYWSVGYKNHHGQVSKESVITFQRIVDWTEKDYDKAADRALHLNKNLDIK